MKSLLFAPLFLASITFAESNKVISTLATYCEKNQTDPWAKNSESCRLVRGEYQLEKLCEGFAKGNNRVTIRLQSIAEKYAELKSMDSDLALQQLCTKQIGSEAIDAKPECTEEREGKKQISRKWWNGTSWVTTTETPATVKEKAEKGDRNAQFNIGVWYLGGAECVARDIKVAAPFLCRAYDQGEKAAGLEFQKVNKHPSDFKAREMFGKENGCELTENQKIYAAETKRLEGIAKDLLKKAESGDVAAMIKVATLYQATDEGLSQDFKKAFFWAEKAANKGNAEAMGLVGSLYSRGDGVEKSQEKAFEWSLKAAQKGDVDSMYFVGLNFHDGQGTEEDLTKAVLWLGRAMDSGHIEAKDKLMEMYLKGELQAVAFKSLTDRLKKIESKK